MLPEQNALSLFDIDFSLATAAFDFPLDKGKGVLVLNLSLFPFRYLVGGSCFNSMVERNL